MREIDWREMFKGVVRRMRDAGESHEMGARWLATEADKAVHGLLSAKDAEIARLQIDTSNHAADAETVRRERDALIRENGSLRDSLAKCRTSYCGYSLSGSYDEAAEIVSRFHAELSRIDQVARSAISGTPIAFTFANEQEHKEPTP